MDTYGSIEYACIKSCLGNVVHTLLDTSKYTGIYLPGFVPTSTEIDGSSSDRLLMRSIDHVAFAVSRDEALSTMAWYETVLGMKRFLVNQ
jgi:4-hydroxyphenylpyruvate dioxygenase-like putative hemolysin